MIKPLDKFYLETGILVLYTLPALSPASGLCAQSTRKKSSLFLLLFLFLFFGSPSLHSQVTIGTGLKPINGAILDLKQNERPDGSANSAKGLMLPRVTLTDLTDITVGDIAGVDNTNKDAHTGLTVYNLSQCDGLFARGVYTWTGTKWMQLTSNMVGTVPANPLTGGSQNFCIPSDVTFDVSAEVPAPLTVDWYDEEGILLEDGEGVTVFTTPELDGTTTFYAQVRNTSTGCISATRAAFTAVSEGAEGISTTSSSTSNTVLYKTNDPDDIDDDTFVEGTIPEIRVTVDTKSPTYSYYWEVKALGADDYIPIPGSDGNGADNPSGDETITFTPYNHDFDTYGNTVPTGQDAYDFQNMYLYRCVVASSGCEVHIPTEGFEVAWGCGTIRDDGTWAVIMCHNLGANENVSPYENSPATWGDLYQWGRQRDGHEKRTSSNTNTLMSYLTYPGSDVNPSLIPTDASFVTTASGGNWSTQSLTNVWGNYVSATDHTWVKGVNDPCPAGWHILDRYTTEDVMMNGEWKIENGVYKAGTWLVGPACSYRHANGSLTTESDLCHWWVAPLENKKLGIRPNHFHLSIVDGGIILAPERWWGFEYNQPISVGMSVRCVK